MPDAGEPVGNAGALLGDLIEDPRSAVTDDVVIPLHGSMCRSLHRPAGGRWVRGKGAAGPPGAGIRLFRNESHLALEVQSARFLCDAASSFHMVRPEELTKDEPLLWSAGHGPEAWDLFCACAAGDLEAVERLLRANPSLVRAHYEYRTALYFAIRENQMAVARFLLDHGGNPFFNGEDLIEMSRIRRLPEMEALIESCRPQASRVSRPSENGLAKALADAAGRGQMETVRSLLQQGADPNAPEEGNAPHGRALYAAVYNRHVEVARVLLEHGANPNQEVESSADAPSIAIMNSDTKMVELLASARRRLADSRPPRRVIAWGGPHG